MFVREVNRLLRPSSSRECTASVSFNPPPQRGGAKGGEKPHAFRLHRVCCLSPPRPQHRGRALRGSPYVEGDASARGEPCQQSLYWIPEAARVAPEARNKIVPEGALSSLGHRKPGLQIVLVRSRHDGAQHIAGPSTRCVSHAHGAIDLGGVPLRAADRAVS